jgi:hypothetical protein
MSRYAFWFYGSSQDVCKNLWRCFLSRITKAAVTTGALCFELHLKSRPLESHNSCAEAANQIGEAHAYILHCMCVMTNETSSSHVKAILKACLRPVIYSKIRVPSSKTCLCGDCRRYSCSGFQFLGFQCLFSQLLFSLWNFLLVLVSVSMDESDGFARATLDQV